MATSGAAAMSAPARVGMPWWVALIAGIAMAIVGLLMLSAPGMTIVTLTQFLGFYWLVDGIVKIVSIFIDRTGWGWKLLIGIVGIIAGMVIIQHPLWSTVLIPATLVFMFAFAGLFIGILEIVSAFMGAGWGTGILGVLSVIFGLLLLFNPGAGVVALPFVFGILAVIGGIAAAIASIFVLRKAET
jgi:uncharacterized membrane protein HdeD (DUF308 family)